MLFQVTSEWISCLFVQSEMAVIVWITRADVPNDQLERGGNAEKSRVDVEDDSGRESRLVLLDHKEEESARRCPKREDRRDKDGKKRPHRSLVLERDGPKREKEERGQPQGQADVVDRPVCLVKPDQPPETQGIEQAKEKPGRTVKVVGRCNKGKLCIPINLFPSFPVTPERWQEGQGYG